MIDETHGTTVLVVVEQGPPGPAGPDLTPRVVTLEQGLATKAEQATLTAEVNARTTADNLLAPKNSPALTGTPTTPTPGSNTNNTQIANTAWVVARVQAAIDALVNGASSPFDTIKELEDLIAANQTAITSLTSSVNGKLAKSANLSDLLDVPAAQANLGLGSIALLSSLGILNITGLQTALDAKASVTNLLALQAQNQQLSSDLELFTADVIDGNSGDVIDGNSGSEIDAGSQAVNVLEFEALQAVTVTLPGQISFLTSSLAFVQSSLTGVLGRVGSLETEIFDGGVA
jgi:hypothetical protein